MILHASAIEMAGRGLLILGRAGAGKSGLALRLIAGGARLVADDGVELSLSPDGALRACAPGQIRGLIEARGVGVLRVEAVESVDLVLAVDLDRAPAARLPHPESITLLERELELISGHSLPNIDAVLTILLQKGVRIPT